jgi:hypothetical protein
MPFLLFSIIILDMLFSSFNIIFKIMNISVIFLYISRFPINNTVTFFRFFFFLIDFYIFLIDFYFYSWYIFIKFLNIVIFSVYKFFILRYFTFKLFFLPFSLW